MQMRSLATMTGITFAPQKNSDPSLYLNEVINDRNFLENILNKNWVYKNDSVTLENIWKLVPNKSLPNWEYVFKKQKLK